MSEDSVEFRALLRLLDDLQVEGFVIVNDDEEARELAERIYNCGVPPAAADKP